MPHDSKGHVRFPLVKKVRRLIQATESVSEVGRYVLLHGLCWTSKWYHIIGVNFIELRWGAEWRRKLGKDCV